MSHTNNHVIMRVLRAALVRLATTQADQCCGHAGVQRAMVCVWCASNTHHALSPWKAGLSGVERGWMRRRQVLWCRREDCCQIAGSPCFRKVETMCFGPWPSGRRPEPIAAEFSFLPYGVPLFTPLTPL